MLNLFLKVIGCGDAFGSGGQINTCFFVKGSMSTFLIDCGATTLPALKKYDIDVKTLDIIIISHFHGDHYGGLPFILLDLAINGQDKSLTIVSPKGCREKVLQLTELLYPGTPVLEKLQLKFVEYQANDPIIVEDLMITAIPVIHAIGALPHGLKIEVDHKVIGFSGDTEWTDELLTIADGTDLFICECNFYKTVAGGHLNLDQLTAKRPQLKCKKLLLTHAGVEMLANLDKTDQNFATEGLVVNLE